MAFASVAKMINWNLSRVSLWSMMNKNRLSAARRRRRLPLDSQPVADLEKYSLDFFVRFKKNRMDGDKYMNANRWRWPNRDYKCVYFLTKKYTLWCGWRSDGSADTATQDRTNGGTHPNVACENKQIDSKSFKNRNAQCTQCSVKGYMWVPSCTSENGKHWDTSRCRCPQCFSFNYRPPTNETNTSLACAAATAYT